MLGETFSCGSIVIGTSPKMRATFDLARAMADNDGTVLITGETGTGKEVMANMIHRQSRRSMRPFGRSAARCSATA